jgi:Flp pilus assembly protein TadB
VAVVAAPVLAPLRGGRATGHQRVSGARRAATGPLGAAVSTVVACLTLAGPRSGLPAAAALAPPVALTVRWLQRRPVRREPDRGLPLVLDLAAAALRSGRPVADALALAAPAAEAHTAVALDRVAALTRLGADPAQAWSAVPRDGPLTEVARVAIRSAASGLRLASGFERLAGELRVDRAAAAAVRAHRAAVGSMAPLAACFLPSFVCLGVVPVVVGVARNAFSVLP